MPTFESSLISGNEPAKAHNEGANVLSAKVEVPVTHASGDLIDFFELPNNCYVDSIVGAFDVLDSDATETLVWKLGTSQDDDLFGTGFVYGQDAQAPIELLTVDNIGTLLTSLTFGKLRMTITTVAATKAAGGVSMRAIWRMA